LAFKAVELQAQGGGVETAKRDLLPSLHGREIMTALSLSEGKTLLTGSEDTTFKVLRVGPDG